MSFRAGLFFVFAACAYYPGGGTADTIGIYHSLGEARSAMAEALAWFDKNRPSADRPWAEIAVVDGDQWKTLERVDTEYGGKRTAWRAEEP